MAIKVEQLTQTKPVEAPHTTERSDGSFKFTLASHIEEAELQEKLNSLMNDITEHKCSLICSCPIIFEKPAIIFPHFCILVMI